jgi:hypothetical protein
MKKALGLGVLGVTLLFAGQASTAAWFGARPLGVYRAVQESSFPQVILLASIKEHSLATLCSGTLVGPRAILTAAHFGKDQLRMVAFTQGGAFLGTLRPNSLNTDDSCDSDLAILELDRAIKTIPPWSITLQKPAKDQWIGFAGYGVSDPAAMTGAGTQRLGGSRLSWVREATAMIENDSLAVAGDSGGPLLAGEGSSSRVAAVACLARSTSDHKPVASIFTLLGSPGNAAFVQAVANERRLEIQGLATVASPDPGAPSWGHRRSCIEKAAALGWDWRQGAAACEGMLDLPDSGRIDCISRELRKGADRPAALEKCAKP